MGDVIDVFVSRPTWVSAPFQPGIDAFMRLLEQFQMRARTLGTTDFATQSPLDEIIRLVDRCSGAVILGYPQITVSGGSIKDREITPPLLLATEWNHLEAGLAYARRLPLLVVHHEGVSRGIFDRGAINSFIYEKDFSQPGWPLDQDIHGALLRWKTEVADGTLRRAAAISSNAGAAATESSTRP